MSRSRRCCKACGRAIRGAGIFLYETPRGPVELCGGRRGKLCLKAYNGEAAAACDCAAHQGVPDPARRRRRRVVAA